MNATIDEENVPEVDEEVKIGNTFSLFMNKKLGSGAFGEIYKGRNKKTEEDVAIKIESFKCKTPQLNYESKILKILEGGCKDRPKFSGNSKCLLFRNDR